MLRHGQEPGNTQPIFSLIPLDRAANPPDEHFVGATCELAAVLSSYYDYLPPFFLLSTRESPREFAITINHSPLWRGRSLYSWRVLESHPNMLGTALPNFLGAAG